MHVLAIHAATGTAEREEEMLTIQIHILCPGTGGEILPAEPETMELLVEDLVSQALLELLGIVLVEKVEISFIERGRWDIIEAA